MRSSIDSRKKDALASACFYTCVLLVCAVLTLYLRSALHGSVARFLLLLATMWDLGIIIPIWISLKFRIHEINGGEEDAALQY